METNNKQNPENKRSSIKYYKNRKYAIILRQLQIKKEKE